MRLANYINYAMKSLLIRSTSINTNKNTKKELVFLKNVLTFGVK